MDTDYEVPGKMDWSECVKKKIAKNIKKDENLIKSTRHVASLLVESANSLPKNLYLGKITLLYDALREYLECFALDKGYKIYNHECYTYFLKEIVHMSNEGDIFDKMRKIRNGINYYGKNLEKEETEEVINKIKLLIEKIKNQ